MLPALLTSSSSNYDSFCRERVNLKRELESLSIHQRVRLAGLPMDEAGLGTRVHLFDLYCFI